jgi:hypothetical protein
MMLLLFAALAGASTNHSAADDAGKKPHIMLFVVDDLGWHNGS